MEVILLVLGAVCLLAGLAGAVLPIPGPPLSFVGMLLLHWTDRIQFSSPVLWSFGIATLVITVLDYYIPVWGTKKFGGTRYGSIGSVVGMLAGLFLVPAIGIFLGAFLGALGGELLGGAALRPALRAAFGSFVGFITGIAVKVILCLAMLGYAVAAFF